MVWAEVIICHPFPELRLTALWLLPWSEMLPLRLSSVSKYSRKGYAADTVIKSDVFGKLSHLSRDPMTQMCLPFLGDLPPKKSKSLLGDRSTSGSSHQWWPNHRKKESIWIIHALNDVKIRGKNTLSDAVTQANNRSSTANSPKGVCLAAHLRWNIATEILPIEKKFQCSHGRSKLLRWCLTLSVPKMAFVTAIPSWIGSEIWGGAFPFRKLWF